MMQPQIGHDVRCYLLEEDVRPEMSLAPLLRRAGTLG